MISNPGLNPRSPVHLSFSAFFPIIRSTATNEEMFSLALVGLPVCLQDYAKTTRSIITNLLEGWSMEKKQVNAFWGRSASQSQCGKSGFTCTIIAGGPLEWPVFQKDNTISSHSWLVLSTAYCENCHAGDSWGVTRNIYLDYIIARQILQFIRSVAQHYGWMKRRRPWQSLLAAECANH